MSSLPLAQIMRHEWRLLVRSRAAWVVGALLLVVTAAAAWNGVRWTTEQQHTIARLQSADAARYDDIYAQLEELARLGDPRPPLQLAGMAWYVFQPEGAAAPAPHIDPRRAEAGSSEWGGARYAVLPPAPLGALAVGQSDLYPFYTRVTIRTRPALVHSDEIENPVNLLSGRFDLAFVLAFCWPLLVLPLFYNVLSEERESGTLALVASQPVSLRAVLAARLAVRGGFAVALTLMPSLMVLGMFGGLNNVILSAMALWIGAIVATALFWCGLAALVNLARWRSAANATVLTACWLASAVILPAALGEVASMWAPVPSRIELINAVRQAGSMTPAQLTALVDTYYEGHPDATPTSQSADVTAIRGLAQQDEVDARVEPILSAYRAATAQQQRVVDRLRYLSPPLVIYDAVTELAGTTSTRYRGFADQVDDFHRAWRDYFYPLVHTRTTMTRHHYEMAPRFEFREEASQVVLGRTAGLIATAATAGAALLAIAGWRAARAGRFTA